MHTHRGGYCLWLRSFQLQNPYAELHKLNLTGFFGASSISLKRRASLRSSVSDPTWSSAIKSVPDAWGTVGTSAPNLTWTPRACVAVTAYVPTSSYRSSGAPTTCCFTCCTMPFSTNFSDRQLFLSALHAFKGTKIYIKKSTANQLWSNFSRVGFCANSSMSNAFYTCTQ